MVGGVSGGGGDGCGEWGEGRRGYLTLPHQKEKKERKKKVRKKKRLKQE